jgi:DNA-binding response OmpR family regulator
MPKMLIADDNAQIRSVLTEYAKLDGFTVYPAADGEETLALFHANTFDMILLDVMMPKRDGFEICREIRRTSQVPIIMVTARGEDFERIMGLDIGADDYIVKPFSPGEVMARVRAILRRLEPAAGAAPAGHILQLDNLMVNLDQYHAEIDGKDLSLTKKELELLWLMAGEAERVFTRDNLLDQVWGYDYFGDTRTVDSHIKRLRAKLDSCPHPHWQIKTVWGVGYKFEVLDEGSPHEA